jgi:tetratricopeptide (TPR) repeat protein
MHMLALTVVFALGAGPSAPWTYGGVDAALRDAGAAEKVVVVLCKPWSHPCHELHAVATSGGLPVALRSAARVWVAEESEEGRALRRRSGVFTIPTTLVLSTRGDEVGRVEGFAGAEPWRVAMDEAASGGLGLAAAEKALAASPDDRVARVRVVSLRLARGDSKAAAELTELAARDDHSGTVAARDIAAWYLEIHPDFDAAEAHLRRSLAAVRGKPAEVTRALWLGKVLVRLGRPREALEAVDAALAGRDSPGEALLTRADFMVSHGYDAAEVGKAARAVLGATPDAGDAHFILAQSLQALGDVDGAARAIAEALRVDPRRAVFADYSAWLRRDAPRPPPAFPFR